MLESIVNSSSIYYMIGGIAVLGILSKLVVSVSLNRLVKAASNMSKSSHGFMRLVRAKFEHAHMLNDRVENIEVFVEKYILEYKVMGMTLYAWQWFAKFFATLVGIGVLLNVGLSYYYQGMSDAFIECVGIGGVLFVGVLALYQLGGEKFKFQKMRIYMVDYLENVCGLRYSRGNAPKEKYVIPMEEKKASASEVVPDDNGSCEVYTEASRSPISVQELNENAAEEPRVTLTMVEKLLREEAERREDMKKKKSEEVLPNESTIREILQEFMA